MTLPGIIVRCPTPPPISIRKPNKKRGLSNGLNRKLPGSVDLPKEIGLDFGSGTPEKGKEQRGNGIEQHYSTTSQKGAYPGQSISPRTPRSQDSVPLGTGHDRVGSSSASPLHSTRLVGGEESSENWIAVHHEYSESPELSDSGSSRSDDSDMAEPNASKKTKKLNLGLLLGKPGSRMRKRSSGDKSDSKSDERKGWKGWKGWKEKERKKKDRERSGGRISAFMQRRRDKAISSADAERRPDPVSAPPTHMLNLPASTVQHTANLKAADCSSSMTHIPPNKPRVNRSSAPKPSGLSQRAIYRDSSYSDAGPLTRSKNSQAPDGFSPILQEHELPTPVIGKAIVSADLKQPSELIPTEAYNLTERLDLGTFGSYPISTGGSSDIYRGKLSKEDNDVAVKALRVTIDNIGDGKHLKRAARELYMWSNCNHPNVHQFLGLVMFRDRIGMVSPWAKHGNLLKYLSENPQADRCEFCVQISRGLQHLHWIGIVHGDLKGANVLVLDDGTAALTDFDNSSFLGSDFDFTMTTRENHLTVRWAAPELLRESGKRSQATDVYALGMTMLEVMSGQIPYAGVSDLVVISHAQRGKHPDRPKENIPSSSQDGDKFWKLLVACWAYQPAKRPIATQVATIVESITTRGLRPT
ncbi:unnamed protein product [Rhizoctonia solani]|uniref:Protein kinase domain-containing protein n=1 Tax=Rhizoctonia solani TaxID=456999 RepID=A0A8H3HRS7_9AGAM|nr:unnamed protein product [Rhizoctonia solani]